MRGTRGGLRSRVPMDPAIALLSLLSANPPAEPSLENASLKHDMRPPTAETVLGGSVSRQRTQVVYLNYDGATISGGANDARSNRSQVCQGTIAPFGDGQMRTASIQATRTDWAPYGAILVTTRPQAGNYTMAMIGPDPGCGNGASGEAPVDCENFNPNDVVFNYTSSSQAASPVQVANTTSHEIAHSLGLVHVVNGGDMMHPTAATSDRIFLDQCIGFSDAAYCGAQHQRHCGSTTLQNSHREILELLGPAVSDTEPPFVRIVAPRDGATFSSPAAVEIVAEATDDLEVTTVSILLDGVDQNAAQDREPYEWPVTLPAGVYTFEVVAADAAGNTTTSDPVTIEVEDGPGGGDSSGSGSGSGSGSASGSGSGSSGGGDGDGEGDGDGDGSGDGDDPSGGDGDPSGSGGGDGDESGDDGSGSGTWGGPDDPTWSTGGELDDTDSGRGCACGMSPHRSPLSPLYGLLAAAFAWIRVRRIRL